MKLRLIAIITLITAVILTTSFITYFTYSSFVKAYIKSDGTGTQKFIPISGSIGEKKVIDIKSQFKMAPEFEKTGGSININNNRSQPLTMAGLKGKVVLVNFWTYSCINVLRTLPYLIDWNNKYADKGLVIVGIHTPEFNFEKNVDNVKTAYKDTV